jgi:hypothetical protein
MTTGQMILIDSLAVVLPHDEDGPSIACPNR